MIIREERIGSVWTLFLKGDLDPESAHELDEHIRASVEDAQTVILDCSQLSVLSAAGLRALIIIKILLSSRGSKFEIRNCNSKITAFFKNTGFHDFASCAD